jgi:hypothetical protein
MTNMYISLKALTILFFTILGSIINFTFLLFFSQALIADDETSLVAYDLNGEGEGQGGGSEKRFKIGDRVQINEDGTWRSGEIYYGPDSDGDYKVRYNDGSTSSYVNPASGPEVFRLEKEACALLESKVTPIPTP